MLGESEWEKAYVVSLCYMKKLITHMNRERDWGRGVAELRNRQWASVASLCYC